MYNTSRNYSGSYGVKKPVTKNKGTTDETNNKSSINGFKR